MYNTTYLEHLLMPNPRPVEGIGLGWQQGFLGGSNVQPGLKTIEKPCWSMLVHYSLTYKFHMDNKIWF